MVNISTYFIDIFNIKEGEIGKKKDKEKASEKTQGKARHNLQLPIL
jgi:hypothetical protein